MKNDLKSLLSAALVESEKATAALSTKVIALLEAHRKRQMTIFVMVETLIVVAVASCAWYLVSHPSESTTSKALAGLLGLGSGGGVEVARRVWKEWSRSDLLIVLLGQASEKQVRDIIDRLIKAL